MLCYSVGRLLAYGSCTRRCTPDRAALHMGLLNGLDNVIPTLESGESRFFNF